MILITPLKRAFLAGESNMSARPFILRCYAEGRPGCWVALSLDLDISVEGESFEAVYHSLNRAMAQYFEYVATLPVDEQARLLARRAPVKERLRYIWYALKTAFSRGPRNGNPKGRAEFTIPRPAVA
jgi:hypothetical protein